MRLDRALALAQGGYFVATGLWGLLDIDTFEAVTGPKTDDWLVKTVSVLVLAIGATLLLAARRSPVAPETVLLAVGSAFGLAAIDVVYVLDGTISAIYLADAAVEVAFAVGWSLARFTAAGRARSRGAARWRGAR